MRWFVLWACAMVCVSMSYASWQNPVLLSELNDFTRIEAASWPTVSSDESQIIFVRFNASDQYWLWQANKNPVTGVYEQARVLSELGSIGGRNIFGTWLSKDSLRLYYCADDPRAANNAWGRNLWMAIRTSPAAPWVPLKKHSELQFDQYVSCASLTADELHIMVMVDNKGANSKIFTASRPSVFHNFANIVEAHEFAALGARLPYLSLDGLTVYFVRPSGATGQDCWVGFRQSLSEPFANFAPLTGINSQGDRTGTLYPSWDGKRVYYFQRQGVGGDLNAMGIFVSEWVDDSFPDVVNNIQGAIEKKHMAVSLLTEASEQEQTAYNLLLTLPADELPADVTARDITAALKNIERSLVKQEQVLSILRSCVGNLQASLLFLLPPLPPQS